MERIETRWIPRAGRKWSKSETTQSHPDPPSPCWLPTPHPTPHKPGVRLRCPTLRLCSCTTFPQALAPAPSPPLCSEPTCKKTGPASNPCLLLTVGEVERLPSAFWTCFLGPASLTFPEFCHPYAHALLGSILPVPWGPHSGSSLSSSPGSCQAIDTGLGPYPDLAPPAGALDKGSAGSCHVVYITYQGPSPSGALLWTSKRLGV